VLVATLLLHDGVCIWDDGGRKRQLAVENAYWQLIMAGVGTVEACQRVGITRKTGYRWPAERGGLPPLRVVEEERGPRYLSLLERRLATLRRTILGGRAIAHELGRSPSTVSRDLALQGLVQAKLELEWRRNISRPGFATPTRSGVPGTSVTRRSTRPSITAGIVA
jgi:hypothetical protein